VLKKIVSIALVMIVGVFSGCEDEKCTSLNKKIVQLNIQNYNLNKKVRENEQLVQKLILLEEKIKQYKKELNTSKNILKKEYQNEFEAKLAIKIRDEERKDAKKLILISIFVFIILCFMLIVIYLYKKKTIENMFNQKIDYYNQKLELKSKYNKKDIEELKSKYNKNIDYYQEKVKSLENNDMDEVYKRSLLNQKFDNKLNEIDIAIENCTNNR